MKYLHIILLVHTLTYVMLFLLTQSQNKFEFVYDFLKEKRALTEGRKYSWGVILKMKKIEQRKLHLCELNYLLK